MFRSFRIFVKVRRSGDPRWRISISHHSTRKVFRHDHDQPRHSAPFRRTPSSIRHPPAPAFYPATIAQRRRDGGRTCFLQVAPPHTGTPWTPRPTSCRTAPGWTSCPSQFCGRAAVLNVSHLGTGVITADFLRAQNGLPSHGGLCPASIPAGRRSGIPRIPGGPFPCLDQEAAQYLVRCGLKGVGTDALSVGPLVDQEFSRPQCPAGGRSGDPGEPVPDKRSWAARTSCSSPCR